ncbi:hypothetical protein, partial [Aliivibrio sp. EL58]|uniref:hypothetical protein n=1 Tax=Aliivibrio sp. EL58 TaxID=2107582 RepID=UPI001C2012F6
YNVNKWFSYNTMKVVSVADSSKSPDKISIERISSNNFALCLNINQKQKLPLSIESKKRPESKWIGSKMKGYTSQVDFNDCYRISTDFIKILRGGAFLKIDNTYYLRYSLKGFSSIFDSKFNS